MPACGPRPAYELRDLGQLPSFLRIPVSSSSHMEITVKTFCLGAVVKSMGQCAQTESGKMCAREEAHNKSLLRSILTG